MKRPLIKRIAVAAFLTLGLAPRHAAYADTLTLSATQDAWIDAGSVNQNKGRDTKLHVRSSGPARRTLVQFNLSSIPQCAPVASADLQLTVASKGSASRIYNAHQLTSSWTQAGVTWSRGVSTQTWTTGGGDFNSL